MNNHVPPTVFVNECCTDIEQFGRAVGWDLNFQQIEPGPLNARVIGFGHEEIQVMRVEFDLRFHQTGYPPMGPITLGLPDRMSGVLRWNGFETPPGVLINFNHEKKLDCVNPHQFGGFVLFFNHDVLHDASKNLGFDDQLLEHALKERFWAPQADEHGQLRQILHTLEGVASRDGNEGLKSWETVFNSDIAFQVIRILAKESVSPQSTDPKFRIAAMERAMMIIGDDTRPPPRIKEICKVVGASRATLERAFIDEFGVTPRSYIKSRRLSGARSQLIKTGPAAVISDVANHWGFWHMGSFAADYRKQFGELPSQTLKRL